MRPALLSRMFHLCPRMSVKCERKRNYWSFFTIEMFCFPLASKFSFMGKLKVWQNDKNHRFTVHQTKGNLYKLKLGWYTFEMVNALAIQKTNNLHVHLFLHLIYLQISQIHCIILTEETSYSNKYDIWQTSMSK